MNVVVNPHGDVVVPFLIIGAGGEQISETLRKNQNAPFDTVHSPKWKDTAGKIEERVVKERERPAQI